jgi:hypothetical protein
MSDTNVQATYKEIIDTWNTIDWKNLPSAQEKSTVNVICDYNMSYYKYVFFDGVCTTTVYKTFFMGITLFAMAYLDCSKASMIIATIGLMVLNSLLTLGITLNIKQELDVRAKQLMIQLSNLRSSTLTSSEKSDASKL